MSTFAGIHVALLVHDIITDGILVNGTAKEGLHLTYKILDMLSMML